MSATLIWLIALLTYALFYCWYVGFRSRVTPAEVEETMAIFDASSIDETRKSYIRHFLSNDDGKDFVMVNLLELAKPRKESSKKLQAYQKIFLGQLLRKAGHPILIARAASGNIENVACQEFDNWTVAGMIRYRSRRDLMEILPATIGSEHHELKLSALDKTFAFPASPWFVVGGPKLLVPLLIALIAAVIQLSVS
ncbi:hypothetical protein N9J88_05810 [Porticoccaceae bacterium]|nr:hypothetical protein [Porticoccaceae bacterium]